MASVDDQDRVNRTVARCALVALVVSALFLGLAPLVMPADYSWVSNSISESAAQGIDDAWVARVGFLLFGVGVVLTTLASAARWRWPGAALNGLFGVLMMCAAVFSTQPWNTELPFDEAESTVHSLIASTMGFAYCIGVLAVLIGDPRMPWSQRGFSVVATLSAILLPLGMVAMPPLAGILQRLMFAIAYAWFAIEAVRSASSMAPGVRPERA